MKLVAGEWIAARDNLVITGPTGVGKSWLACALVTRPVATTVRSSTSASPSCFSNLALARGDGRHERFLRKLGSVQLLISRRLGPGTARCARAPRLCRDLEERYGRRSTIVTSQLPIASWHH
nr:ATP-binding protein [Sphingobium sp. GW456-12-10-14-TSB1]